MKMGGLIGHLKIVNERIQNYKPNGRVKFDQFLNWACYDFLDKILECPKAKKYFDKVYFYFENIYKNSQYNSLMEDIFNIIIELGNILCSDKNLEAEQAGLKTDYGYVNHQFPLVQKDYLTTKEFAEICRDKNNYQKLGAKGGSFSVEDIAPGCSNQTVLRQFKAVENFYLKLYALLDHSNAHLKEATKKIKLLNSLIIHLEKIIVTEPTKLHYKTYWWLKDMVYDAMEPGNLTGLFIKPRENYLERIQSSTSIVLEDLLLIYSNLKTDGDNQINIDATKNAEILYEVKYQDQKILLNKLLISKTEFMSTPDELFRYFFEHPNKKISQEEIQNSLKKNITRRLPNIITDLGFTGNLRKIFFPNLSKSGGIFVNPITYQDLTERQLSLLSLETKNNPSKKGKNLKKIIQKTVEKMPPSPAVWG